MPKTMDNIDKSANRILPVNEKNTAILAYLSQHTLTLEEVANATGLSQSELHELDKAGVFPAPSYVVTPEGVWNALSAALQGHEKSIKAPQGENYYGHAIVTWLRRAHFFKEQKSTLSLMSNLKEWLFRDCYDALYHPDCRIYGWSELFAEENLQEDKVQNLVNELWDEWMSGLLGICVKEFDGYYMITKIRERARIQSLLEQKSIEQMSAADRIALGAVIIRLHQIVTPFDPITRPTSTRGRWIEEPGQKLGLYFL